MTVTYKDERYLVAIHREQYGRYRLVVAAGPLRRHVAEGMAPVAQLDEAAANPGVPIERAMLDSVG